MTKKKDTLEELLAGKSDFKSMARVIAQNHESESEEANTENEKELKDDPNLLFVAGSYLLKEGVNPTGLDKVLEKTNQNQDQEERGEVTKQGGKNKTKEYKPTKIIYKKVLEKLIELNDLDYGWQRLIEVTPGIELNEEGTLVVGKDGFNQPTNVGLKAFQNTVSRMRRDLKNKKEQ